MSGIADEQRAASAPRLLENVFNRPKVNLLGGLQLRQSFVPQVWQTWRSKNASSISLLMYSVLITGSTLWLVYGLMLSAWPLVVANAVTLSLVIMIWFMKLRYR